MYQTVLAIERDFLDQFFSRTTKLKPVLITFSGIDGSGKSTQIEKLREYLASEGFHVRQMAFWDDAAVFRKARSGFSRRVLQSDGSVGSPEKPALRRDKNLQNWPLFVGRSVLHLLDVVNLWRVVRKNKQPGSLLYLRSIGCASDAALVGPCVCAFVATIRAQARPFILAGCNPGRSASAQTGISLRVHAQIP